MLKYRKNNKGTRLNLLRARKVGASSIISALAFYDAVTNDDTHVLVLVSDKSNGILMDYYAEFWRSLGYDEEVDWQMNTTYLPNSSTITFTSIIPDKLEDYNFIHVDEPLFHDTPGNLLSEIGDIKSPSVSIVVESTSPDEISKPMYGAFWEDNTYSFNKFPHLPSFFIPWYVCDDFQIKFKSHQERYDFEDDIPRILEEVDAPFPIPTPGIVAMPFEEESDTDWMSFWEDDIYFDDYQIETENINWYYHVFEEYGGDVERLVRDYPTFSTQVLS